MNRNQTLWLIYGLCLLTFWTGCDSSSDGPTAEDLLRAKRQREKEQIAKAKTPQERLQNARSFVTAGNPVAAEDELRPLLIATPNDPDVLLVWADIQATSGRKPQAIETLKLVKLENSEQKVTALWKASQWLISLTEFDEAEQQLLLMLELPGDKVRVLRSLSTILNNQGRRREAGIHLKSLAKTGEIQEKELISMVTLGNPFLDRSMAKPEFGDEMVPALLVMSRELKSQGDFAASVRLCKKLAETFPNSTQIQAFLGRIYADQQDSASLRDWLQQVPDGIEIEAEYWHAIATLMQLENQPREAIRCFLEAVLRDETDRPAYLSLAQLLNRLDRSEEAKRFLQRSESLAETSRIAKSLGLKRGTSEQLHRIADLMDQMQRPWESLAWRKIALKQQGASDDRVKQIEQDRLDLISSQEQTSETIQDREAFRLCDLKLTDWPLPNRSQSRQDPSEVISPTITEEQSSPVLVDIAEQTGLYFQYLNGQDPEGKELYIHQVTGGGIGVVDFDLDGWPDLYLSQGGGEAFSDDSNRSDELFRNYDGSQWRETGAISGVENLNYGQGVCVADLNQDGWPDILVANLGDNVIHFNNGDGSFRQAKMPKHPRKDGGWTTSIACGDVTGDHLPEIFEVNYLDDLKGLRIPCGEGTIDCNPVDFIPAKDYVFTVQQDGSIDRSGLCVGIEERANYGFGVVIANFDQQGGNDVFIANDTQNNHFWVSQPNTNGESKYQLVESASILGCGASQNGLARGCMGVAFGDFDRNQKIDLYISNFWKQAADLYLMQSSGSFAPGNYRLGLFEDSVETVGWGTQAADFNHDGWLDIAVLNGHVTDLTRRGQPFEMRPQLFEGSRQGFSIVKPLRSANKTFWSRETLGRTLALIDWNRDGRMDLIANHLDQPVALLENQTQIKSGKGIQFELVGTASERDAIGATLTVKQGDQIWTAWQTGGDGFLCTNQNQIHLGVGELEKVESVTVTWPSGVQQTFSSIPTDASYLVIEGQDELLVREP
ncbi:MAG: FG-GAP-like repeat-containing protein [Planctomycetota bacterium]|nr:FG-GAP-like repeat-containing protein [Planctomycetota bacterium]